MKVVVDSSCELSEVMKKDSRVISVPLRITVAGTEYVDDDQLDVSLLLDEIDASSEVARTSCPSPEDFMRAYEEDSEVIVVTLTGALSGTFNSARLAKDMTLMSSPEKKIHIFNTNAASIKETLVALYAMSLDDAGCNFEEIVEKTQAYMDDMHFFFHLDVLDTLIKNGRMSKVQGKVASLLNIKLIMTATDEGEIDLFEKSRTSKRTMKRIVKIVGEVGRNFEEKRLGISYCDCFEKANQLKEDIMKAYPFKDVVLLQMRGLSSTYANRGGIILSF